jgi:signal transduction histidine kinase
MEEDKLSLEMTPFSLRNLVTGSLAVVSLSAEKKSLKLISQVEEQLPLTFVGDPVRLRKLKSNFGYFNFLRSNISKLAIK